MSNVASSEQPKLPERPPVATPSVEDKLARKRELLAKVRVLHQAQLTGQRVDGDPTKEYMWVNHREERQLFFQALGWTKCFSETKESIPRTPYRQEDGSHKRADLILYEISKEMYEAHQAYKELSRIESLEGAEAGFVSAAHREGVPTYKPRV